jgi:hypothetical protein
MHITVIRQPLRLKHNAVGTKNTPVYCFAVKNILLTLDQEWPLTSSVNLHSQQAYDCVDGNISMDTLALPKIVIIAIGLKRARKQAGIGASPTRMNSHKNTILKRWPHLDARCVKKKIFKVHLTIPIKIFVTKVTHNSIITSAAWQESTPYFKKKKGSLGGCAKRPFLI